MTARRGVTLSPGKRRTEETHSKSPLLVAAEFFFFSVAATDKGKEFDMVVDLLYQM
jgi:hypothetical protein